MAVLDYSSLKICKARKHVVVSVRGNSDLVDVKRRELADTVSGTEYNYFTLQFLLL